MPLYSNRLLFSKIDTIILVDYLVLTVETSVKTVKGEKQICNDQNCPGPLKKI